jgi:hypothetical protein
MISCDSDVRHDGRKNGGKGSDVQNSKLVGNRFPSIENVRPPILNSVRLSLSIPLRLNRSMMSGRRDASFAAEFIAARESPRLREGLQTVFDT